MTWRKEFEKYEEEAREILPGFEWKLEERVESVSEMPGALVGQRGAIELIIVKTWCAQSSQLAAQLHYSPCKTPWWIEPPDSDHTIKGLIRECYLALKGAEIALTFFAKVMEAHDPHVEASPEVVETLARVEVDESHN